MKYNFDEIHDRSKNQSVKWDALEDHFGSKNILPMWVADMDFKTSEPIIDALKARVEQGIFGYTVEVDQYRQSIIDWCKNKHDWSIKKEWILYSPGVVPTLSLAISEFTGVGDKVVIQPPVYAPFERVVEDNNRELLLNPLKKDDDGYYTMDLTDLENKFIEGAKTLILCNPHNPVGRVWNIEELESLERLTSKYGVLVISDEIHSDLIMKNNKHIPFASINSEHNTNVIICMAPTKTFNLAGIQTSYVILPNEDNHRKLADAFGKINLTRNNCFGQVSSIAAYEKGDEWLTQMLEYIEDNIDFLIDYINKNIPEIKVMKPEGTYLVWLDLTSLGFNNDELKEFMVDKAKIALIDGGFFGLGGEGFMRFNVATPRERVADGVKRIENAISKL